MTTEYRDGTIAELQEGDGFTFGEPIRLDDPYENYGVTPAWEYLGKDQYKHVEGLSKTYDRLIADEGPNAVRIWPAYFKDKELSCAYCNHESRDYCKNNGRGHFLCTRPPGHSGKHIACSNSTHEIETWEAEFKPPTLVGTWDDLQVGDKYYWIAGEYEPSDHDSPAWEITEGTGWRGFGSRSLDDGGILEAFPDPVHDRVVIIWRDEEAQRTNWLANESFESGDLSAWSDGREAYIPLRPKEPGFDLEAFRAKVEEQLNATPKTGAWDAARGCYQWVLDLLPPKPQETPEEIMEQVFVDRGYVTGTDDAAAYQEMTERLRKAGWLRDSPVLEGES